MKKLAGIQCVLHDRFETKKFESDNSKMDTFVLNAVTQELQQQVCPSRINNIWQPGEDSLILGLWRQGKESRLAISVAPQHQYLFLTSKPPENQVVAFGKFLQYHIKGGELQTLYKPVLERILTFEIAKKDIDGQEIRFRLILEIMGRHSNLILINKETNKILDSMRHVTAVQSSYRRIVPGAVYISPPTQEKDDPMTLDRERFQRILRDYEDQRGRKRLLFWKFFLQRVKGFSPLMAKEVAGQDVDFSDEARWQRFSRIIEVVKSGDYQPMLVIEQDEQGRQKPVVLSAVPLQSKLCTPSQTEVCTPKQNKFCTPIGSMNRAAELYYMTLVKRQQYETFQTSLLSTLNARLSKLKRKQEHLLAQKEQIDNAEQYKKKGELITANIYQLKKGMQVAEVIDYYAEDQHVIEITLDPKLTPAQNAQRYFKRYNKLKHGKDMTMQRLHETKDEIAYLEEWKFFVEEAKSLQRLKDLRDEFHKINKSDHKEKTRPQDVKQEKASSFLRFVSSDGLDIYVGRSSKENDLLTQHTALPDDIWLHVHQAPGSHVLIVNRNRNAPVPEQTLVEAASLAAYYSKSRHSGKVEVVYTPKKYVRKPKGSPPGLVTLLQYQTIRVVPRAEIRK
jgi:predicted ribosome quality control (RQC) complex YloA/Tae2 family protein